MNAVHGSCVALGGLGVLIRGRPGDGKSSLCLSLIDAPGLGFGDVALRARLVADDQVVLQRQGEAVLAAPPPTLAGKLEIRGLGIITVPFTPSVTLGLVVDLLPFSEIARLPEPHELQADILGLSLPRLALAISDPAAPARLRAALGPLGLLQRASFFS